MKWLHKEGVGPHLGDVGLPQGPAKGDIMASGMLESDQMIPAALKVTFHSSGLQLNH